MNQTEKSENNGPERTVMVVRRGSRREAAGGQCAERSRASRSSRRRRKSKLSQFHLYPALRGSPEVVMTGMNGFDVCRACARCRVSRHVQL